MRTVLLVLPSWTVNSSVTLQGGADTGGQAGAHRGAGGGGGEAGAHQAGLGAEGLELEPGGSARLTHTAHPDKAKCDQNQFTRTFVFGMLQPFHFHIIDTWNKISP